MFKPNDVYIANQELYVPVKTPDTYAFINLLIYDYKNDWKFCRILHINDGIGTVVDLDNKQYNILIKHFVDEGRLFYLHRIPLKKKIRADIMSSIIDSSTARKEMLFAIDDLCSTGEILNIDTWSLLPDCMKTRAIIYMSNNSTWVKLHFDQIREMMLLERNSSDKLIECLLTTLLMPTVADPAKRQAYFKYIYEKTIEYITEEYAKEHDITAEMASLMPLCEGIWGMNICQAYKQAQSPYIKCPHSEDYQRRCDKLGTFVTSHEELTNLHIKQTSRDPLNQDWRNLLYNCGISNNEMLYIKANGIETIHELPYRVAAYVSALTEEYLYLRCRACNSILYPDFEYTKRSNKRALTIFSCKNEGEVHDKQVYINHCFHYIKHRTFSIHRDVVDSRECRNTENDALHSNDDNNPYLCMYCGGGIYRVKPLEYCPRCLSYKTSSYKTTYYLCSSCGHDGSNYGKWPTWSETSKNNQFDVDLEMRHNLMFKKSTSKDYCNYLSFIKF